VNLRCPAWAGPGTEIKAQAGGVVFKVNVPQGIHPGMYFRVKVRIGTNGKPDSKQDIKPSPDAVEFNMEPNIIIGKKKYFKEVKQCAEWCDCTKICWPYVRFNNGKEKIQTHHNCCCLPCFFDFEVSETDHENKITKQIGQIKPASLCDQKPFYIFCPCFYTGQKVTTKFATPQNGEMVDKFHLRTNIEFCQYLCLFLAVCIPCVRLYRFCCSGDTYSSYTQQIYTADNDNDSQTVAKITYTDRMICPCVPDERVSIKIEQEEKANLTKEDLILLSTFPQLVSGYTSMEFAFPLYGPCGLGHAMPTPTGVTQIDEANAISCEAMSPSEAFQQRGMD
jgi:hypothetical protein